MRGATTAASRRPSTRKPPDPTIKTRARRTRRAFNLYQVSLRTCSAGLQARLSDSGNHDLDHVQAVEERVAEGVRRDALREVAVAASDDPERVRSIARSIEQLQQLVLPHRIEVSHFLEERGAAGRRLPARLGPVAHDERTGAPRAALV